MNFEQAYEYCYSSGGRLIEIHSREQMDFLNKNLGNILISALIYDPNSSLCDEFSYLVVTFQMKKVYLNIGLELQTLVMKENGSG